MSADTLPRILKPEDVARLTGPRLCSHRLRPNDPAQVGGGEQDASHPKRAVPDPRIADRGRAK